MRGSKREYDLLNKKEIFINFGIKRGINSKIL